jgi:hypothetical protein
MIIVVIIVVIMAAQINADVEVSVIPIRFMIAAPLPGCVHPGDVLAHLAALLAVATDIAVDFGSIRFKAAVAFFFPVLIRASGTAQC